MSKSAETDRVVKTRDSATSALRKLGVNSRDYNLFIEKTDGGFLVKMSLAASHVGKVQAAPEPKKVPVMSHTAVVQKMLDSVKEKKPRVTVSSVAEELILAGKSNDEVWTVLKERFKLDGDKRHYPSWYRSRLRRQGKLPKRVKNQ